MNLSNLKPAEGSTKQEKESDAVRVLVWEVLLPEVIKELNQDLDTLRKSVLKVVRCLFNVVFLSLALKISIV